jgi:ligand-binding sensor domain-containing protein/signal transduction histidine kinase
MLRLLLRNLNILRDKPAEYHGFFRLFLASLAVVCLVNTASALDPNRALSDYIYDRWGAEQGFPGQAVYSIAQTPDGYLWLGTEKGLVRFDGLNFRLFNYTNSPAFPAGPILELMIDAEENLWIRPQSRNLVRYRAGTFQDVTLDLDSSQSGITAMCRGIEGEALFEVRTAGTFIYRAGRFSKLISTVNLPNILIISMAQTSDGKLWMGTRDAGLFFRSEGQMVAVTNELPDKKINSLLAVDNRELWIGTDGGVVRWNGDALAKVKMPDRLNHFQALAMVKDKESNIWIGTGKGLLRLNGNGVSSLDVGSGTNLTVNTVFVDREGNLWIGSTRGIERLRDTAFMTYPFSNNRSSEGSGTGYVDAEERIWCASSEGGLYWQKDGQTEFVKNDGLSHDIVYSLTGSNGELWIGRRRGGLTQLKFNGKSVITRTYTQSAGLVQNSIYAVHQSRDGTIWAGSISGGLSRFKDGKFTTYTTANGLSSNTITAILESSDKTMWFGTANGLCALRQGNWTRYRGVDDLPPGSVNCLLEDSNGTIWIGTDNGIAFLRSGQIQLPPVRPEVLQELIIGLAEDRFGGLWISTLNHILRIDRDNLERGEVSEADVREFGLADGLRSVEGVKRHRSVAQDTQGRIWFSTNAGLSVVDPSRVASSLIPAIGQIEGIMADGNAIDLKGDVHIPGGRERITFSYAGLSLAIPERVRFRYRLDGFDKDWSKPVATREANYTNLAPGPYRFRVIASNSDGLWNAEESTIQFEILPVFWQTWWFRLSVVMVIGLSTLGFYRLRMHRLTKQLNVRFEERLAERIRIAQDLHDTLLQGFLSISMQLHVAADQLPADSPTKPLMSRILELMRQVIDEGRTALKGLRSATGDAQNIAESFSGIPQEFAPEKRIDFQVIIEGYSRPLRPVIRDEVYRIGREALVNAFRHSKAKRIEVIIEYSAKQLRILVRDNGCGIDPQVLDSGREGHWGLSGMRERAEEIGARLRLLSGAGNGTEVELSIPGDIAFDLSSSKPRGRWLARLYPRKAGADMIKAKRQGK